MNLNKNEKSAARKRAFREKQSQEEKEQATFSNTSARSIARGDLTSAEQMEASDRDRARLQALRNSQSEEEKEQASEEAQARMAALRGIKLQQSKKKQQIRTHPESVFSESF